MRFILYAYLALALVISVPSNAQSDALNVVTDFFHYNDNYQSEDFYSDHFSTNPGWSQSLIDLTDSLLHQQMALKKVEFRMDKVAFKSFYTPDVLSFNKRIKASKLPGYKQEEKLGKYRYISIYSKFQTVGNTVIDIGSRPLVESRYILKMGMTVLDKKGKTVHKNTINIPFLTAPGDYLYQGLISKDDFKLLYEDGLAQLLQYDPQKMEVRKVGRQHYVEYDSFTSNSDYYQFVYSQERRREQSHALKDQNDSVVAVFDLNNSPVNREFTEEYFGLNLSDRLKMKAGFFNGLLDQTYEIVAGYSIGEYYEGELVDDNAIVIFRHEEEELGRFAVINDHQLIGKWKGSAYQINYFEELDLIEINRDKQMVAVQQSGVFAKMKSGYIHKQNLFVSNAWNNKELGELVNVLIAFQLAYDLEVSALEEEDED